MKKIITLLLLAWAVVSQAFEYQGLQFRIVDEDEQIAEVTYMLPNDTLNYAQRSHIDIPPIVQHNAKTYQVGAIGDSAFRMARSLKTISIPSSVTRIGKQAFYGSGLTEVSLPNSVVDLGDMAFAWCYYLQTCNLSDKIQALPSGVFAGTYSMNTIDLPPQLKVIGDGAFYESALGAIELPQALEQIEAYAFAETFLRKIKIPDHVQSIGYMAFDYVPLDSVWFGQSLREIGERAFSECFYLHYINGLPRSLQVIDIAAFEGVDFRSLDLVIPGSVRRIGELAFCPSGLRSVVFEQGVDTIESGAFGGCYLKQVEIPASVSYLGSQVFEQNFQLPAIQVDPDNLHYTAVDGMLANKQQDTLFFCPAGREGVVRLPESFRTVDDLAFSFCSKLTTVILNEGLTRVGDAAFNECESLDSVYVPQSIESFGRNTMDYTKWSQERGSGLQYLGPVALNNKHGMYSHYIIKEGTTCIADEAFSLNDNLKYVKLPKGLKYIGANAFCNNRNLTSLRLPESVKRIGRGAFQSNIKLFDINIPEGVETIDVPCFGLTNLKRVYCYTKQPLPGWCWGIGDGIYGCILYVPQGCKELYQQTCGSQFASVREMGPVGDLNDDMQLDIADVNQMVNMMLGGSGNTFLSDLNGDQVVDIVDVNELINHLLGK